MKRIIAALIICLLLTGCWDQLQLKKLLFVMSSGSIMKETAINSMSITWFPRFGMPIREEEIHPTYIFIRLAQTCTTPLLK